MRNQSGATRLHDDTDSILIKDYIVRVRFDDGTERVIDFEPILIGPMFGPLRDQRCFDSSRWMPRLVHSCGPLEPILTRMSCTIGPSTLMPSSCGGAGSGQPTTAPSDGDKTIAHRLIAPYRK